VCESQVSDSEVGIARQVPQAKQRRPLATESVIVVESLQVWLVPLAL
jgi:hypothetical protein